MKTEKRIMRCKYGLPFCGKRNSHLCRRDGWEEQDLKIVTNDICEECDKFESKYIEYPLTINGIENEPINTEPFLTNAKCGDLCEIKPCAKEYDEKSYIGFYIGNLPINIHSTFDLKTKILKNTTMTNPAIFVPELKKIVYGCESWWRKIESVEDFKGISEEDIDNTWYVKLLKKFEENNGD